MTNKQPQQQYESAWRSCLMPLALITCRMKLRGWRRCTGVIRTCRKLSVSTRPSTGGCRRWPRDMPCPNLSFGEGCSAMASMACLTSTFCRSWCAEAGPQEASGKLIIAHLGNGASMVAIENGRSLDTTMGLTPAGGLVMGTRVGDLDPGVMLYLLQEKGMTPAALNHLINHQAGLLGTSGISSDMQTSWPTRTPPPARAWAWRSSVTRPGNLSAPWLRSWVGWTPSSSPAASARIRPPSEPESVPTWNFSVFAWTRI